MPFAGTRPTSAAAAGSGRPAARWRTWLRALALIAGLACIGLLPATRAAEAELSQFEVQHNEDGVLLSYAVDFELSRAVEDALSKTVPLYFVAEAQVFRDRWYWRDRRVASTVRVWRIVYQPLTQIYRVTFGGLSQNHATRAEALAAISRGTRWKIAEPGQIEEGSRHYVEFSYRLDTSLLPRPLQIGISGQPDWTLAVSRTQRFD
ncbi:MAG: DUF4390 domain-containing protein [Burkholderiaceae bacterium]